MFDNIRYTTVDATREKVEQAARAVGAHDFILRLPNGYDTELEQRGANLSLGQRQLISFARALVADAPILIWMRLRRTWTATERQIQLALDVLLKGRTAMVIAHRLATIRDADRILVLKSGELVESGTHNQLLEQNGLYAELYTLNFASFDDIDD